MTDDQIRTQALSGKWSGYTEGVAGGRIYLRIDGISDHLTAIALILRNDGFSELYQFQGRSPNGTDAVFTMDTVVVDAPYVQTPRRLRIESHLDSTTGEMQAKWSTDILTYGTAWLRKQGGIADYVLAMPYVGHCVYRYSKLFFRKWLRYAYLMFTVTIATYSALSASDTKLNFPESILLTVPLIFLFGDKLRFLIHFVGLKEAGPLKFEQQPQTAMEGRDPNAFVNELRAEFGDHLDTFFGLERFLVPRTIYLLRLISHYGRPLSQAEFTEYALSIGIPNDNILLTVNALASSKLVTLNDAKQAVITPLGHDFLRFAQRTHMG